MAYICGVTPGVVASRVIWFPITFNFLAIVSIVLSRSSVSLHMRERVSSSSKKELFWKLFIKRLLTREVERLRSSSLGSRFLEGGEGFALSCRARSAAWRPSSLSSTPRRVDSLRERLTLDSGCISGLNVAFGDGSFLGSGAGEFEWDLGAGWCGSTAASGCGGCCSNSLNMFYFVWGFQLLKKCDIWYNPNEPQLPGITLSHSGGSQKCLQVISWEALIWMERF